jgi:hypothetical protein
MLDTAYWHTSVSGVKPDRSAYASMALIKSCRFMEPSTSRALRAIVRYIYINHPLRGVVLDNLLRDILEYILDILSNRARV